MSGSTSAGDIASLPRGLVCPHCKHPLGVARTWPAGRGLTKRRRICRNPRCPFLRKTGESYRETSEERLSH